MEGINIMPYGIGGLTLLDQTTIEGVTKMQTWAGLIAAFSLIFALAFIIAALVFWGESISHVYVAFVFLMLSLFTVMLFVPDKIVSPEYIKYSVIIDDNVSMNEFLEHYEILERHGKIYEIREIINDTE